MSDMCGQRHCNTSSLLSSCLTPHNFTKHTSTYLYILVHMYLYNRYLYNTCLYNTYLYNTYLYITYLYNTCLYSTYMYTSSSTSVTCLCTVITFGGNQNCTVLVNYKFAINAGLSRGMSSVVTMCKFRVCVSFVSV